MEWNFVERPGYLGKKRDEVLEEWNQKYGKGNWRLAYQWGPAVVSRTFAIQLYEDGYYEFLKNNNETLEWLIKTASDVFDTAESNVRSGLDYQKQETKNNHLHDISIRRAILRLGRRFEGDKLIHVRWKDSEGYRLSPGIVPFHIPDMILSEEIKSYSGKDAWWRSKTIEDFYQRNKILQIKA